MNTSNSATMANVSSNTLTDNSAVETALLRRMVMSSLDIKHHNMSERRSKLADRTCLVVSTNAPISAQPTCQSSGNNVAASTSCLPSVRRNHANRRSRLSSAAASFGSAWTTFSNRFMDFRICFRRNENDLWSCARANVPSTNFEYTSVVFQFHADIPRDERCTEVGWKDVDCLASRR
jgi:hypothetical protein